MLQIEINGERREIEGPLTLKELVTTLGVAPERLAIELNYKVVRRVDWETKALEDGDRIEIVHFVGGGGDACC